jgi:uncharacterized protein (TIGR02246 family)
MTTLSAQSSGTDESEIRLLYTRLMNGWNLGSGEAFAAPFDDDADLVAFDGTHFKGREQIALFHQEAFNMFLKGTRLVGKVRSVKFLSQEIAVMHTVGGTIMAGKTDIEPERNSVQTIVVAKRGGKWSMVAFQNTRATYVIPTGQGGGLTEELRKLL